MSNALKIEKTIFNEVQKHRPGNCLSCSGQEQGHNLVEAVCHLAHPVNNEETPRDDRELMVLTVTSHHHCGITWLLPFLKSVQQTMCF